MFIRLAFCAFILLPMTAEAAVWMGPSGSDVTVSTSVDDFVYGPFNLNLSGFSFFGATQTDVNISSNGNLQFGTTDPAWTNQSFPYDLTPMIAPFWDDLYLPPGTIKYNNSTAGQFVATWSAVGHFPDGGSENATFQAVLFGSGNQYGLAAGSILFNYQGIINAADVFTPTVGLNSESSAVTLASIIGPANGSLNPTEAAALSNRSFLFTPSEGSYTVQEINSLAAPVPEPASLVIWGGLGIAGLVAARRRKTLAA